MIFPVVDPVGTGANIERLRKAAGLAVGDLQKAVGVSAQAIHKWRVGAALPSLDNLVVLAALLDVRIDEILVVH